MMEPLTTILVNQFQSLEIMRLLGLIVMKIMAKIPALHTFFIETERYGPSRQN